jgi:hypothetical protein
MYSSTFLLILATVAAASTNAFAVPDMFRRQDSSHADLTIGKTQVPLSTLDGAKFVGDGLRELCGDKGCDGGSTHTSDELSVQFETFGDIIGCKWTVIADGNYDNADEKDYMINLITTSLTETANVQTITVSIEDNPLCTHQGQPSCTNKDIQITSAVNFQQIVLNLENGANTAELSYNLGVECQSTGGFDCPNIVQQNLKDALSAVPAVGAAFAQIFNLVCA